jgi:hypothetical protein
MASLSKDNYHLDDDEKPHLDSKGAPVPIGRFLPGSEFQIPTEYKDIEGLNKEKQKLILINFLTKNNLKFSFNEDTKNANASNDNYHYKYILPHVAKYYQKMEEKVPELLKAYHPNYNIITYQGHNIMRTDKFGESLNNKSVSEKNSFLPRIKEIMKQFLQNSFYHGDLYTDPKFNYSNVLIDKNGHIKLIDFGLVEIEKNTNKDFQTLFEESEENQLEKEKDRTRDDVKVVPPTPARRKVTTKYRRNLPNLSTPSQIRSQPGILESQPISFESPPKRPRHYEGKITIKVHKL